MHGSKRDRVPGCMHRMRTWAFAVARAGIVVKLKVAISFYQVMNVFGTVYGIEVDPEFAHLFDWFAFTNFNVLRLIIPSDCLSTLKHHMLIDQRPMALRRHPPRGDCTRRL